MLEVAQRHLQQKHSCKTSLKIEKEQETDEELVELVLCGLGQTSDRSRDEEVRVELAQPLQHVVQVVMETLRFTQRVVELQLSVA